MNNSKLLEIIKTLTTKELTWFKDYVRSPFFNKNQKINDLCEHIVTFAPNFDTKDLEKEKVFAHLFGTEAYNNTKLHTHTSNLLQLLGDYLAMTSYQERGEGQQKIWLLQKLREKKAEKHYRHISRQFELEQEKKESKDATFYKEQMSYHQEKNYSFLENPKRVYNAHLQLSEENLNTFFVLEKLKLTCDMLNRNKIIGSEYQSSGIDFIEKWIKKENWERIPVIKAYFLAYQLLLSDDKKDYFLLKEMLVSEQNSITKEDAKTIYDYLINYCIKQMNGGLKGYKREFFELHQYLLSEKILLENGNLSEWDYKNLVTVGASLGEYEWAENFIYQYKDAVDSNDKENVFTYNLAYLNLCKQKYDATLSLLHQVDFTDVSYHIGAKIIQLKCYFALNEDEAALSLIAAFGNFLKRNKSISEHKKKTNLNMLKFAKKIIAQKNNSVSYSAKKNKEKIQTILAAIEKTNPIANVEWLVEQLE